MDVKSDRFEQHNEETYKKKQGVYAYKKYIALGVNVNNLALLIFMIIFGQVVTNSVDFWLAIWTSKEMQTLQYIANSKYKYDWKVLNTNNSMDNSGTGTTIHKSNKFLERNVSIYIYSTLVGGCILMTIFRSTMLWSLSMKASTSLYNRMFYTIIRTPISF